MKVYRHANVKSVQNIYGGLLQQRDEVTIEKHLSSLAEKLWIAYQKELPEAKIELSNYLTGYQPDQKVDQEITFQCIANEYGFKNWSAIPDTAYDQVFEQAIDDLLTGNIEELKQAIAKNPQLISQKSRYGHKATLLHYTASNGVELWRQQVPENMVDIAKFLLDSGANPKAKMNVYGGQYEVLPLLETSAHPKEAGLLTALKSLFI